MITTKYNPGALVHARNRDWVVQPSDDDELLVIKPLGGTDEETTAIYLPLNFAEDKITSTEFPKPTIDDIGDISTAALLYNAARLSFRNGAGPFRSIAKLSFRPRSYQMVPLIMALRQEQIRLLISDDVGVGKTVEALLVVKEMLERRKIKRFAVVCLPHLCEQWQAELRDKFDIEAVIIRSNTQARLDREIQGDTSVYEYYPYQIISIDFIKTDHRRNVFINECPEMVIVDEAHTCAKPAGAQKNQQLRHSLLSDISKKENQHLVMLTATPHSGKPEEFQSLLGLLNTAFENIDLPNATQNQRRELAKGFVQRRRADVEKWMNEETVFPERDAEELDYQLSKPYAKLFHDVLEFAQKLISGQDENNFKRRVHYWTALALLRGVMSSPAAGVEMLKNRIKKLDRPEDQFDDDKNPVYDREFEDFDSLPLHVVSISESLPDWTQYQAQQLNLFAKELEALKGLENDSKAEAAVLIVEDWLKNSFNSVVFCRYIETAKYVGEIFRSNKDFKNVDIQVVTSEDPDEIRKDRIDRMGESKKRILICTDCLSEGINLQAYFTAVLHYDLPWNPNRLEQREGRIDRFGQTAKVVKASLLYSKDNPIDGVLFDVLLRKVREIRRDIGISMPLPENNQTILDTVLESVLLNTDRKSMHRLVEQPDLFEDIKEQKIKASKAIDEAAEREKASRSIFAQNAIHAQEIEADLKEVDEAIGDPKTVEHFVMSAVNNILGAQISPDLTPKGFDLYTTNLPESLKNTLPDERALKISFYSPTPQGYVYIGRNHLFVEQLCQLLMASSVRNSLYRAARAAVIRTSAVTKKTTLMLFRVRNVIEERKNKGQLVAEEMLLWGYRGVTTDQEYLTHEEAKELLRTVRVTGNMSPQEREMYLKNEMIQLNKLEDHFNAVAFKRAEHLVEAHERFSRSVGSAHYQVVTPVLPMDKLGFYILMPDLSREGN